MSPKEIFETQIAAKTKNPDAAARVNAVYRFELSGDDGGQWIVDFKNETAGVRQGDEPADCTLALSAADFVALVEGKLNPQMAFMKRTRGRLGAHLTRLGA